MASAMHCDILLRVWHVLGASTDLAGRNSAPNPHICSMVFFHTCGPPAPSYRGSSPFL